MEGAAVLICTVCGHQLSPAAAAAEVYRNVAAHEIQEI